MPYGSWMAAIGSMRMARSAGSDEAAPATTASSRVTSAMVRNGSDLRELSGPDSSRVTHYRVRSIPAVEQYSDQLVRLDVPGCTLPLLP